MIDTHHVTSEQKQAASESVIRAVNILQSPQNGNTFDSGRGELVVLTEANRSAVVRNLLAAIVNLIPADHPQVPLRAEAEKWLNS